MEPFVHKHRRYLEIEQWQQAVPQLIVGFSTRNDGNSHAPYHSLNVGFHVGDDKEKVRANRLVLAEDIGVPLSQWIGSEQVHEATIRKVSSADAGKGADCLETALSGTDGLYTADRNLLLTSLYADCVPLFFLAPKHQLIGLAHAGWRGTVQQIGPAMLDKWTKEENIPLADIHVAIGPCISQAAYEVDQQVLTAVEDVYEVSDTTEIPYTDQGDGAYLLDLRELNKQLLVKAGLRKDQMLVSSICTATDKRMFSHRAEGGKTGRMLSFIGLRS